jgi:hypothetical protein
VNEQTFDLLSKMMGLLERLSSERGVPDSGELIVDKNVIKSEKSTLDRGQKVQPSRLSPKERKRAVETFSIFAKVFFDYKKTQERDSKERTLVEKINKDRQKYSFAKEKKEGSPLMSIIKMVVGGLALVAASIGGIIASLFGVFGNAGGWVKTIGKVGIWGGLKLVSKLFLKRFTKHVLKRLPIVGAIVGFAYAATAFMQGDIAKGVAELISAFLNLIPGVGPILSIGADILIAYAEQKGMFDEGGSLSNANAWGTIKGWASNIGDFIWSKAEYLPILGGIKRFTDAQYKFAIGDTKGGLIDLGRAFLGFIGVDQIFTGFATLVGFLSPKEKPKDVSFEKHGWETIKGWAKSIGDWLWDNADKIPLLSGVKLMVDANKFFKSGRKKEGLMAVANGMSRFLAPGAMEGFSLLTSFFGGEEKTAEPLKSDDGVKKGFWGYLSEKTTKVINNASDWVYSSVDKVLGGNKAYEYLKNAQNDVKDEHKGLVDTLVDSAKETIKSLKAGISNGAKKGSGILSMLNQDWSWNSFFGEGKSSPNSTNAAKAKKAEEASKINFGAISKESKPINTLEELSSKNVELLASLVTISTLSLKELKRISGNNSSGGPPIVLPVQNQSSSTNRIPVGNNRDGYRASPYAQA